MSIVGIDNQHPTPDLLTSKATTVQSELSAHKQPAGYIFFSIIHSALPLKYNCTGSKTKFLRTPFLAIRETKSIVK